MPSRRPSGRPLPRLGEYGDQGVKQFKLTEHLKKLIWGTENQSGVRADQDMKPNEFGEVKKIYLMLRVRKLRCHVPPRQKL